MSHSVGKETCHMTRTYWYVLLLILNALGIFFPDVARGVCIGFVLMFVGGFVKVILEVEAKARAKP